MRALCFVVIASLAVGCKDPPCTRMSGMWHGDQVVADDRNSDPDALRVMYETFHEEQWRLSVGARTGDMVRERVGMGGGQPVPETMHIRQNTGETCVVDMQGANAGHTMTMTLRPDGRLSVHTSGSWFTGILTRP